MRQQSILDLTERMYADEHLSLEFISQSVTLDGRMVYLARKEYDLLALMVQHVGEILPRDVLMKEIWNHGPDVRTRTLDVHMRRIRKKLGQYADRAIETIFGVGYRFQPRHTPRWAGHSVVDVNQASAAESRQSI